MITLLTSLPDRPVAVALSGGRDSMALAHLLIEKYGKDAVICLHVDHGYREESKQEAAQLKTWCKALGWSFDSIALTIDIPQTGIEETLRYSRYKALDTLCKRYKISNLYTAHHADDQFETILMRLCRGTGLRGILGIRKYSKRGELGLHRPLLEVTKAQITDYVLGHKLPFIEDPSNQDMRFSRNALRKVLQDQGFTPQRLQKTLERLVRADLALDNQVSNIWNYSIIELKEEIHIKYADFLKLTEEVKVRIIIKAVLYIFSYKNSVVSLEKVENTVKNITILKDKKKYTNLNCVFFRKNDIISIQRETR